MAQRTTTGMSPDRMPEMMPGFGNDFETEALPGALPQGQNSPQKCAYGLYAEQLSGSPFTAPRSTNERSWLYRMRPSVRHGGRYERIDVPLWKTAPDGEPHDLPLGQYRWNPLPMPESPTDFIDGVRTMTSTGDARQHVGMATSLYTVTSSMDKRVLINADAEMMIVPQSGAMEIFTEMGRIPVSPGQIAVIPRGMMAKYRISGDHASGYICENYGAKFTLPDRGPIGANCLANPRDFKTPVAAFEDDETSHQLVIKWCGGFHTTDIGHSPLDVVAWHGNYTPYCYDLSTFSPVGALAFDHPDPSIFTVLTAPSETAGTANIDFVIFPPRWTVAENTFRPPWYHRNIMSEFMGLITGQYDAKEEGFVPGGASLHNMMLPHGPDLDAFEKASNADLKPTKLTNTMAFMFETRFPQQVSRFAAETDRLQDDYIECWAGLDRRFDGTPDAGQ
ncbi:MAG: homogentisate 1,2-dioxygenase [Candidatus Puniceispirillum sp. TMED245]|nr:MAG: homogentisate 1,2-dioxygenase [Candidatus Puniceispirillum sp. TMED245]